MTVDQFVRGERYESIRIGWVMYLGRDENDWLCFSRSDQKLRKTTKRRPIGGRIQLRIRPDLLSTHFPEPERLR